MTAVANARRRESGIEWLENLPVDWEVSKLGFHASVKARLGWKGLKAEEYTPAGYILLATPNLKGREIDYQNVNYISEDRYLESPEIMVREGDVLVAKDGSTLGIVNHVRSLPAASTVNSSIAVIRANTDRLDSRFLLWLIASPFTQGVIQRMKDGQGVPHLFQADLRKFWIWLPPLPEQRAIAAFLDRETARIDALIEKKERQIELLQEKRDALISHAVTKGLDANARMKESGIEWLGEVPKGWEVVSLRYLFQIKAGGDLKEEYFSPDRTDLHRYPIYTNSIRSDDAYGFTSKAFFGANSITVTGRGEIGYAIHRDHEFDAIIRLLVLSPRHSQPCKYYSYFINAMLEFFGGNTAVSQLSAEQISPYKVLSPPHDEQQAIVTYLDRETARIDGMIEKVRQSIELLREYRTAVISAAVTGKIDVLEEVA